MALLLELSASVVVWAAEVSPLMAITARISVQKAILFFLTIGIVVSDPYEKFAKLFARVCGGTCAEGGDQLSCDTPTVRTSFRRFSRGCRILNIKDINGRLRQTTVSLILAR